MGWIFLQQRVISYLHALLFQIICMLVYCTFFGEKGTSTLPAAVTPKDVLTSFFFCNILKDVVGTFISVFLNDHGVTAHFRSL